MNFSDSEKPIKLRFVDLMIRAHERREAQARQPRWGCLDAATGRALYVNGIPRVIKYCPSCPALKREPHKCLWSKHELRIDTARYELMREWRRKVKNVNKLAAILKENARDHLYRGGATPLSDFRGSWNNLVVEYYHRERDGVTVLTVRAMGEPVDPVNLNVIRQAFGVPASVTPEQKAREDGTYTDMLEWVPSKQGAMAL